MSAKHHIDTEMHLIITTWEGDAIDIDFISALKIYQKNIQSNLDYIGFNEVVDLTKVAKMRLTIGGIKSIGSIASSTDINDVKTKMAIIVSSSLVFYLASMYSSYRMFLKNSTKTVRIFKKESDAFIWVKQ